MEFLRERARHRFRLLTLPPCNQSHGRGIPAQPGRRHVGGKGSLPRHGRVRDAGNLVLPGWLVQARRAERAGIADPFLRRLSGNALGLLPHRRETRRAGLGLVHDRTVDGLHDLGISRLDHAFLFAHRHPLRPRRARKTTVVAGRPAWTRPPPLRLFPGYFDPVQAELRRLCRCRNLGRPRRIPP